MFGKDYRSLASELVSELKKQGAEAADVYIVSSVGFNTTVRLGKIERLQQSISKGLGLRVIKNGAMANTFTTDFTDRAVKDLAKDTMQIVQVMRTEAVSAGRARRRRPPWVFVMSFISAW